MVGEETGEQPDDVKQQEKQAEEPPGPAPAPEPTPAPACRSVVDYDSSRELRKALLTMKPSPTDAEVEAAASRPIVSRNLGNSVQEKDDGTSGSGSNDTPLDWVLEKYDPQVTKVQSMQDELDRLLVLKSYLMLDSQRDVGFDLLTRMASRFFHAPVSAISLVDLGRQWFASTQGLGEGDAAVKETPRNVAFCAHTIQLKDHARLFIVPDAALDARFQDNPLVTSNVVRFYAGAPLLSPEGYKLGAFCVIDSKPRPQGLSQEEQDQLRDLASMAVRQMVDRRALLQRKKRRRSSRKRRSTTTPSVSSSTTAAAAAAVAAAEHKSEDNDDDYHDGDDDDEEDPEQLIAHAANDLMTPLSGVQLSLALLKDDEQVREKLNHHQLELLHTAASCSDFTIRICRTAIDSLRQQQQHHHHQHHPLHHPSTAAAAAAGNAASSLSSTNGLPRSSSYCLESTRSPSSPSSSPCNLMTVSTSVSAAALLQQQQQQQQPPVLTTVLQDLLNGLAMVMKPIPKLTPIILTLEQQQQQKQSVNDNGAHDADADKPPRVIQCDDLTLFRSALNLLSHSLKRTRLGAVHLRIYPTAATDDIHANTWKRSTWKNGTRLMFDCLDTGPLIPQEEWNHLFQTGGYHNIHGTMPDDAGAGSIDQHSLELSSVANFIHSMHGDYGFRQEESSCEDKHQPHSVFWFSVPLIVDKPDIDFSSASTRTTAQAAPASTTAAPASACKLENAATLASVVTESCQSSMQDDGQQQQQQACTAPDNDKSATDPTVAMRRKRSHSCSATFMGDEMADNPVRPKRRLSGALLELAGSAAMQLERTLSDHGFHEQNKKGHEKSTSLSSTTPASDLQEVVGDLLHATNALQMKQGNRNSFPDLLYEYPEQKPSPILFTGQARTTTVSSLFSAPKKSLSATDVIADTAETSAARNLQAVLQPNQAWPATGSTAAITPMDNASTTMATTATALTGRRKKRGLVIDDSLVVRKSLARALEKQGFEVQQAVNGLEGLNRLKETLFDLVLCDFLMPVMDGMDCVKQYRDWERERHASFRQYIVGISAHATSNDGNQGIKAGMDLFKEKPISVRILSELLETKDFLQRSAEIDAKEGASSVPLKVSDGMAIRKRPAANATSCANGSHHESADAPPTKFLKLDHAMDSFSSPMSETKDAAPACLIATKTLTQDSNQILGNLEKNGWETAVAKDGEEALRLLQTRNWDTILMDDDLPILAGTPCMAKFRAWEAENRVNRQRMSLLICSSQDVRIPSPLADDKTSIVLPPHGFDGVLSKPIRWNELNHLLQRRSTGRSFDIVIRK
jgi:CheY-like chemotaxis protein